MYCLVDMHYDSDSHSGVNLHITINLTTTAKMGQFEPLQNDLILRAAWGKSNLLRPDPLTVQLSLTSSNRRREG